MVRVDDTVVVGGSFTSVASPDRSTTWQRQNLFAFDATTGRLLEDFAPQVDGPVSVLVPAAYGSALFVGGSFGEVSGEPSRSLAKLSLTTGRPLAGFTAPNFDARVTDLEVQGERVLVAGAFERVGGLSRPGLVLLDAASGRVDADFDAELADPIEGTDLRVHTMDLAPNGSNLAIGGSFTTVRGKRRPQLAVLDLSGAAPRLTGWGTEAYAAACSRRFPSYLRDVDISPAGPTSWSSRAEARTGARCATPLPGSSCAASRTSGPPGDYTGGDTLTEAAATGDVIYVGGHQRWLNNPLGRNTAAPAQ